MSKSIYCIGMGVVVADAAGCNSFLSKLKMQKSSVRKEKKVIGSSENVYCGAKIDTNDYFSKYKYIAEKAFAEAVLDAGISQEQLSENDRVGLIIGTSLGNISVYERYMQEEVTSKKDNDEGIKSIFPGMLNYITTYLVNKYNITGPLYTISNTCASGISGITLASELLEGGVIDSCIVGGVDINADFIITGLDSLNALSCKDKLQPFSKDRDGIVLGEGAGFIVLANNSLKNDKRNCYGEIAGCSITNDGGHLMSPDKEARGLIKSIRESIKTAKIDPGKIDCVFCCGNGNVYNDAMQALAIKESFKVTNSNVAVTTVKPYIGHTLGAAGIIETIAALLMMNNNFIVPLSSDGKYEIEPPEYGLNYVFQEINKELVYSILLSSGFSGVNATVVLRRCNYERTNQ